VAPGDSTPFYYYQDQKILLNVDPSRLVVSAAAGIDAASIAASSVHSVLAASGLSLDSVKPIMQAADHAVLYFPRAVPAAAKNAVLAVLKQDPRFRFVSPVYTAQVSGSDVIPLDRVIVKFRANVSAMQVRALCDSLGLTIERTPKPDSGFAAYWLTYPASSTADALAIAATLDRHSLVAWADPDKISTRRVTTAVPTDPYFGSQYYLKNTAVLNGVPVDVDAEPAWDLTTGSSAVTVAILDEGVQQAQPDVGPALAGGYDTFNFSGEDAYHPCLSPCSDGSETGDAHGTAVAGIVAARQNNGQGVSGVAPNVHLVAVRVLRNGYLNSDAYVANGINWAWNTAHADVLSSSWFDPNPSNAITNAIQSATASGRGGLGSVVVFSAGNDANNPNYPAPVSYLANLAGTKPGVIAVGAIDRYGSLSVYSNTGPELIVVAPSSNSYGDLTTTDLTGSYGYNAGPGGNNDYTSVFGGTSAAAPQISGIAALLLSREPALLNSQVRDRIRMSADPWGSATNFGAGKGNAYKALVDFQVVIDGPNLIRRSGTATWNVDIVRGASGSYTYTWQWSSDKVSWYTVSTSATYSRYVNLGDPTFYLNVSVNSGLATMADTATINVAP
jgi:subtilisin family serine protease